MATEISSRSALEVGPAVTERLWSARAYAGCRRFLESRAGLLGLLVLLLLVVVAVFAPFVAPHNPLSQIAAPLQAPSAKFPFGTDELGRDIASRVIYGVRPALVVSFGAALIGVVIGTPIGVVSGYMGRWVGEVSMRAVDVLMALPSILLALLIVSVLGPSTLNVTLAIGVGAVPTFARLARASTLSVRELDYVTAERGMGAGKLDIMARTVVPNIVGPLLVQCVVTASVAVVAAAGLSFLGLGTPAPAPSWGGMLQEAQSYLYQSPLYGVFPGVALTVTIAAFDGIGRGLQSALGGHRGSRLQSVGMM